MKLYQAICADPAWQPKDQLPGKSRGATKNYSTMPTGEICNLVSRLTPRGTPDPYGDIALSMSRRNCFIADNALLGLWRLSSMQTDALNVVSWWGFTHKTEMVWAKYFPCKACRGTGWADGRGQSCAPCGVCMEDGKKPWLAGCGTQWFGMGRYLRAAHETCVIATRGAMTKNIKAHNIRSVLHAPVPWDWNKKRIDKRGRVHTGGPIHSAKPEKFYDLIEELVDGPYLELFGRRRRRGWTVLGNQVDKFAEGSVKWDIGQIDVSPYRKWIHLVARGDGGEVWTLCVAPRWARAELWLDNETGKRQVALSSFSSVVGYFLMRAVCRGIDLAEVTESEWDCFIDCGQMPPLGKVQQ